MFIKRLRLQRLLSFRDSTVEFGQLNVLIGPNGVGKSNLIEAIGLLQAAPTSLAVPIRRSGGIRQWIWLGDRDFPVATLHCDIELWGAPHAGPVEYQLQFADDGGLSVRRESISSPALSDGVFLDRTGPKASYRTPESTVELTLSTDESVLSQFKNPADPTPVTQVGNNFSQIRIYREFKTGPQSQVRHGISTSSPKGVLWDGADNLALVLNDLDFRGRSSRIREYLNRFCERFAEIKIDIGDGAASAALREDGLVENISAARMSDGTLKFLALLAALFHPQAPPLLCIEEPELGLHPDAMRIVADALVEASSETQLVVTTHSEALVDALTDRPDSVLVCERDFDNGTQMNRLSSEKLTDWLEHYSLGQLWRKGELGGGRW